MTGDEIRGRFFDYFRKNQHQIVRSSSLVPQDDPTLLFTNAGMVQFKRTFLGEEKRAYARAATSQKCVRAGGKHNDLENVGYTARHHTFFEMLGNFSFGDYFKQDAIRYAWDLLVNGYGLLPEKLWVSVFHEDDDAHAIWDKEIGVPTDRIVRLGEKDNFWSMGDTGPCGPCSEILIDRGEAAGCGMPDCAPGCECDRYLEIWNLVFMQYNRDGSGKLSPLPRPSIDTGMGLERIAAVIQGVPTNYDTDLFAPIMARITKLSGRKKGTDANGDVAMKVIADHSRAAAFLIADGVLPSNEGRGYVLRRILRRAIRYGRNIALTDPFLHETVAAVFDAMKTPYPELNENSAFILNVIKNEEARFSETLDHGLKLLNETIENLKSAGASVIPGEVVFKLYDTYGFPPDIITDVVRGTGITMDAAGFKTAMEAQKEKSRSVAVFAGMGDAWRRFVADTEKLPEFVGYDRLSEESEILFLVEDGQAVDAAGKDRNVDVVTALTPFYAESGGQVGDTGIMTGDDFSLTVNNTIKDPTGLIIHKATVTDGVIRRGDRAVLTVDADQRTATAGNHTATHLLHAALRAVVGDHVRQSGSYVGPDRMRFDFTHFAQVGREVLDRIEAHVNARMRENIPVATLEMDAEEALQSGAVALFEEKYGDRVRVVSLADASRELCGGTHVARTGDIGLFKIIGESSVASGVRRIEAFTGAPALAFIQTGINTLNDVAALLREKPEAAARRVEALLIREKGLEKEIEKLKRVLAAGAADNIDSGMKTINGVKVIAQKVDVESPAVMRDLADKFRDKIGSGITVLGASADGKALLIVMVTKDLAGRFHAGNIIRELAAEVGGKGGGRPDMAQAGGPNPEHLDKAIEKAYAVIEAAG
ncbi:MAG: alanine--tRNA ligase [Desulfobacteraceae bacterium]|jgi:alanyl-tRNA synthetase|nr:MAG: alanine--tRNA ligase [Desulfobacteraceae bacterium]